MKYGFPKKLVEALICNCGGDLESINSVESDDNSIYSGCLECSDCKKKYKIEEGVINFLDKQNELGRVMQDEIKARDKESPVYDKRLAARYFKEIPSTINKLGEIKDKNIIEYACGTGRITTEIMKDCKFLLASDFSLQSLIVLSKKLGNITNVGLVLGDSVQFKTKANFFDIALSTQFLEHIPEKEQREEFFRNIYNTLKNKGRLVLTAYHQDFRRIVRKMPKEGMHKTKIFFHYFSSKELRDELNKLFKVIDLHPIDITLPLEFRLKLPAKFSGLISRLFERIPLINKLGHLLIVDAKKDE
jgi:ubiquinone/menaquinone biosynthesis C-methylase UbiE